MDNNLHALAAQVEKEDAERAFRQAAIEGLTEMAKAIHGLREQTAAFQARSEALHEETQRRLAVLEARDEKQAEAALATAGPPGSTQDRMPKTLGVLFNRIYSDWRTVGLVVLGVAYVWQAFIGPHVGVVLH